MQVIASSYHDPDQKVDPEELSDYEDQGPLPDMEQDTELHTTLVKHIPSSMNADEL